MNMYFVTAPSLFSSDDYLITDSELMFYDKIMEKPIITLGMFLEYLEFHDAEINSFYILDPLECNREHEIFKTSVKQLQIRFKSYLNAPIKEAVYQDLNVRIRLYQNLELKNRLEDKI